MKSGSYTLTCGMGMISGKLSVGAAPASSAGAPWAVVLVVVALLGAASVGYRWYVKRPTEKAAPSRRGSPGGVRGRPAAITILGFHPAELVVASGIVVTAIVIGLASGGYFR